MKYTLITLAALSGAAFGQTDLLVSDYGTHIPFASTTANAKTIDGILATWNAPEGPNIYVRFGELNSSPASGSFDFVLNSAFTPAAGTKLIFANNAGGIWDDGQVASMNISFYSGNTLVQSLTNFTPVQGTQPYPVTANPGDGVTQIDISAVGSFDKITLDNFVSNGWPEAPFGELAIVVPEPSSAALLGLGGLALILRRRK